MPRPKLEEQNGKSENTFDLMSHDSTHVRLVLEAENQSKMARSKAMDMLQKYSKELPKDSGCDKENDISNSNPDNSEERDDICPAGQYSASPYINCMNQFTNNDEQEEEQQQQEQHQQEQQGESNIRLEEQEQQRDDIFNDNFQELTERDLEQIARCLIPLSPKGLKKHKAKQVSGRFEFKRINTGGLSIVKCFQKQTIMSPEDLPSNKKSEGGSVQSQKTKQKDFTPKKGKRGGLRRRFSFSSKSKAGKDADSGIFTDDALLHEENKDTKESLSPIKQGLNKKIKAGDLPPKPTPRPKPTRKMSIGAPSSRATASDVDYEEVISVESDMSDLSDVSVSDKVKQRGPVVLTEAMLETAVIPDSICLKKNIKLTKMASLRRKLSFSKGKI
jgi:hypothetical protein